MEVPQLDFMLITPVVAIAVLYQIGKELIVR